MSRATWDSGPAPSAPAASAAASAAEQTVELTIEIKDKSTDEIIETVEVEIDRNVTDVLDAVTIKTFTMGEPAGSGYGTRTGGLTPAQLQAAGAAEATQPAAEGGTSVASVDPIAREGASSEEVLNATATEEVLTATASAEVPAATAAPEDLGTAAAAGGFGTAAAADLGTAQPQAVAGTDVNAGITGITGGPGNPADARIPVNPTDTVTTRTATATVEEEPVAATVTESATPAPTPAPVAGKPTLTAADVSGNEDSAIALDISAAISDAGDSLLVTIPGVPTGTYTLSVWSVDPELRSQQTIDVSAGSTEVKIAPLPRPGRV